MEIVTHPQKTGQRSWKKRMNASKTFRKVRNSDIVVLDQKAHQNSEDMFGYTIFKNDFLNYNSNKKLWLMYTWLQPL